MSTSHSLNHVTWNFSKLTITPWIKLQNTNIIGFFRKSKAKQANNTNLFKLIEKTHNLH